MTPALQAAMAAHQAGQIAEAETLYAKALALEPGNAMALHYFALLRFQQGHTAEALTLLDAALAAEPAAADIHGNMSVVLLSLGRFADALTSLDRALALKPDYPEALNNRAIALRHLGLAQEALQSVDAALALRPGHADTLNTRGIILQALARWNEALAAFDDVLARLPGHAEALNRRGMVLQDLARLPEALASIDAALAASPRYAEAHNNRGTVLMEMERLAEALASFDAALALKSEYPHALFNRANLHHSEHRYAEAIADLESLLRLAPDYPYAAGQLLLARLTAGAWTGLDGLRQRIDEGVRAGAEVVMAFAYQAVSASPGDLLAAAQIYAARHHPALPAVHRAARGHRKIRIGYVSGEFRQQATAFLTAGLYEQHDRERFEIIAIDNGHDDGSPMRQRLKAAFDSWLDIATLPGALAAEAVAAEEIDILVNLNGYFGRARMDLFARRPAPLQVNYLGFPGTLGASYLDYIIADAVVIPAGAEIFYTEKVVRLPHSYQVNDDRRAIAPTAPTRAEAGLPEQGMVFCNFNQGYKILPEMFGLWLEILRALPGSVLWLLESNPLYMDNLKREARAQGVDPARVIFAPVLPLEEHLARLRLGDLFLDSLPCNAHTTASDVLWAGLPILTCLGSAFAGRVAASLLSAIDVPELITSNLGDYKAAALALAREPARLDALKRKLARHRATTPLFDTKGWTAGLEAAYARMWDIHASGQPPQGFEIPAKA